MCQHTLAFFRVLSQSISGQILCAGMQLRRGQTPDSRSPPQHYCIFKPLSPCGNSQFDAADLQCWQASVTTFSKQRGIQLTVLPPENTPSASRPRARSSEEYQKGKVVQLQDCNL